MNIRLFCGDIGLQIVTLPFGAGLLCWNVGLCCRDGGLFCRDVGLFCRDVGLFCRDVGPFCRDVGLFCRDVGLFCGDIGLQIVTLLFGACLFSNFSQNNGKIVYFPCTFNYFFLWRCCTCKNLQIHVCMYLHIHINIHAYIYLCIHTWYIYTCFLRCCVLSAFKISPQKKLA